MTNFVIYSCNSVHNVFTGSLLLATSVAEGGIEGTELVAQ